MKTLALIVCLTLFSIGVNAANKPCSGKKGGISHCQGGKFVCNDGTISESKQNCTGKEKEKGEEK